MPDPLGHDAARAARRARKALIFATPAVWHAICSALAQDVGPS